VTFLLDNDVPDALARVITQTGHIAERLRDLLPRNTDDVSILAFANTRHAVLVTCNRDHFLALAANHPHAGIVVLQRRPSRIAECSHFLRLLPNAGESGIRNNINFA
jgi:predicted nuclease of predicted toxin-antitoxin system